MAFKDGKIIVSERAVAKREAAIREHRIGERCLDAAAEHAADDSPWFALKVMPGRELAVENDLKTHGIESLVPMRKGREIRRRGRLVLPTIPVMVGYVLVRFEPSVEAFIGVCGLENVDRVVGGMVSPRSISHSEVKQFEERARNGWFDWSQRTPNLKLHVHVVVTHGPFKGAKGKIVSARGDGLGDAVVEFFSDHDVPPALLPLAILEKL
jgi:transcriptional antiterminator NusG